MENRIDFLQIIYTAWFFLKCFTATKKNYSLEAPGIDPGTSRMLSERSTIWATPPFLKIVIIIVLLISICQYLICRTVTFRGFRDTKTVQIQVILHAVLPLVGGQGGLPEFGSSVNPITTRGADYAHHITASPPRFENPAASLSHACTMQYLSCITTYKTSFIDHNKKINKQEIV